MTSFRLVSSYNVGCIASFRQDIFKEADSSHAHRVHTMNYDALDGDDLDSDRYQGSQSERAHRNGTTARDQKHDKKKNDDSSKQKKLEPSMKWKSLIRDMKNLNKSPFLSYGTTRMGFNRHKRAT